MYAEDLEYFGIISPAIKGLVEKMPVIYLKDAFTDIANSYIIDGEVQFAKLREADCLDSSDDKSRTPDGKRIILLVNFLKQSTGAEYLLAFTPDHIYHWNTATKVWDLKFTCSASCETWDYCIYNDMVIATNDVDPVIYWDAAGNFAKLGHATHGIIYSYNTGSDIDAESASGQKVVNLTATTNFKTGDIVILDRGNANEETGIIDTIAAGASITLTENLTNTHAIGVDVEICLISSKAKYVATKDNYLILGYPTDNKIARPTRIRWSAIGNEDAWDQVGSGGREIGMTGKIVGFGDYQNFLVVFKDRTIQFVYLVSGNAVWNNYVYASGIGGTGHLDIVNDPEGNLFFFGSDGVFREIKDGEISFIIDKYVRLIDPDNRHLIQGMYFQDLNQIWWAVPYDNALNNRVLTYDVNTRAWSILKMAVPAMGYYHES